MKRLFAGKREGEKKTFIWLLALVLGAGILAIISSCGGSGSEGSVSNVSNKNVDQFLSQNLSFKISTEGGTSNNAPSGYGGGYGGNVTIENGDADGGYGGYGGGGGDIKILKTIPEETGFTFTLYSSNPNLGDNPARVTSDTTFAAMSTINEDPGTNGTVYLKEESYAEKGTDTLFISDGDGDQSNDTAATGLYVAKDVTLTLELMDPTKWTQIMVTHDVDNHGTIKTADTEDGERGALYIDAARYFGNSSIDTSGVTEGQSGGDIQITVDAFVNKGNINSFGVDDPSSYGGYGGRVAIDADVIENSGDINASAGGGYGGFNAPNIALNASSHLYNAGDITSRGASTTASGYNGSTGGTIYLTAQQGDLVSIGNLDAGGGSATGTNASSGYGGSVYISAKGDILLGGDMDASAGDSENATGRSGGTVAIYLVPISGDSTGQSITFVGYSSIETSGGDSQYGDSVLPTAGDITIENSWGYDGTTYPYAGNIVNEASLIAMGGSIIGPNVSGWRPAGHGGSVTIETIPCVTDCVALGETYETVENAGDINTSGGDCSQSSGRAGNASPVTIDGNLGVTNSGDVTAVAGTPTNGASAGSDQDISLTSDNGTATNSGILTGRCINIDGVLTGSCR